MTLYVGETTEIESTGVDFDGTTPLDQSNTTLVALDVIDPDGTSVVNAAPMIWSSGRNAWLYLWNTTGLASGTYKGRATYHGVSSTVSFEFLNIRLHQPKF